MKLLAALLILLLAALATLWFGSAPPSIAVAAPPKVIGKDTPIPVRIESPHGVRRLAASVEQNGKRYSLFEQSQPAVRLLFWKTRAAPADVVIHAGQNRAPALKDGKARIIVEAQANDFRARSEARTFDVEVITAPPRLLADSFQHYLNQGGAEMAVFQVSGYWNEAGVRVGPHEYHSHPLPGSASQERFALFVLSWDVPADTQPVVFARNAAGMEVTASFWLKTFPKKFRKRDLAIDDAFLQKVVNQIDPSGSGDLLTRFLKINGDMRRRNNQALSDLARKTEEKFLWNGPFLQLANSKVESQFADRRTYVYKGKKVDEQVHLGFDLSVTRNVPVAAANDGRVIYAADLGIYGNCIVLDHGYGLQSIYAHLASFDVKPGDLVKKTQTIGRSDSTGLAGGDHLHFSMQIDGVETNPVEWWDDHWIQDRIRAKLPKPPG